MARVNAREVGEVNALLVHVRVGVEFCHIGGAMACVEVLDRTQVHALLK